MWRRDADQKLVYLTCVCGKVDFKTVHGFMCHFLKKHNTKAAPNQMGALEYYGHPEKRAGAPGVPLQIQQDDDHDDSEGGSAVAVKIGDEEGKNTNYRQEIVYSDASDDGDESDEDQKMSGVASRTPSASEPSVRNHGADVEMHDQDHASTPSRPVNVSQSETRLPTPPLTSGVKPDLAVPTNGIHSQDHSPKSTGSIRLGSEKRQHEEVVESQRTGPYTEEEENIAKRARRQAEA